MWLMTRKKGKMGKAVGISVAVLVAAHLAVGVLLCKNAPRRSRIGRTVKKAGRTVKGFVREFL